MKRKKRYIARMDQVTITRRGSEAVIEYKEFGVPGTHLDFEGGLEGVTDEEILESFNENVREEQSGVANYKHIAFETPIGSPQLRLDPKTKKVAVHGHVLRCVITEDDAGQLVIQIDDRRLKLAEFGGVLTSLIGWGVRMEIVPTNAIDRRPELQVRELGLD